MVIEVIDVGSMLGDCCLWTMKRFPERTRRCDAYEPLGARALGLLKPVATSSGPPWRSLRGS